MHWQIKHYYELSATEFHDLVALRIQVFVVEQNCPYQELDGKDKKAYHVIGRNGKGDIVATARILPAGVSYPEIAIGRVVVHEQERGTGLGHVLMEQCHLFILSEFGPSNVRISAQKHLKEFYKSHNFVSTQKEYLEDGIPHIEMIYKTKN